MHICLYELAFAVKFWYTFIDVTWFSIELNSTFMQGKMAAVRKFQ